MKFNRVTALLLSLTLAFSLAACGQGASSASTASSSSASSAAAESKTEEQLLAEENEILSANDALWEKVFASMDKSVTETTLSTNYGDFLLSAVEKAKDQFSDEEYKTLTADAEKIRDIENQIAALKLGEGGALCGGTGSGILCGGKSGDLLLDGTNLFGICGQGLVLLVRELIFGLFHSAEQKIAVVGADRGFGHVFVHG